MPLFPCPVYQGPDYLQFSLFDALVSMIQPFGVPFFICFCLPKPAAIDDKTVERPGLANLLSISERLRDRGALPRFCLWQAYGATGSEADLARVAVKYL
jgi:hypothetical protein